jgi:hypothetical protein
VGGKCWATNWWRDVREGSTMVTTRRFLGLGFSLLVQQDGVAGKSSAAEVRATTSESKSHLGEQPVCYLFIDW